MLKKIRYIYDRLTLTKKQSIAIRKNLDTKTRDFQDKVIWYDLFMRFY